MTKMMGKLIDRKFVVAVCVLALVSCSAWRSAVAQEKKDDGKMIGEVLSRTVKNLENDLIPACEVIRAAGQAHRRRQL
jgi:hypothetical protein